MLLFAKLVYKKHQLRYILFSSRRGSVIANFTVYYVQVSQGEVLLLQDFIDTTGKMYNLSTIVQEVKPTKGVLLHTLLRSNLLFHCFSYI